jgi:hypothetical protein
MKIVNAREVTLAGADVGIGAAHFIFGGKSGTMMLASTGNGTGVSTLRLQVSEDMTVTLDGAARFYTDEVGTLGESTSWTITAGALQTINLKVPSGSANLNIPNRELIIRIGWNSSTDAASLTLTPARFINVTDLNITGTSTLIGALPTGLTYLYLSGTSIAWTYNGALPTRLTYLYLYGTSIAWTYNGALPTRLTYLLLYGTSIAWTYNGALPTGLTYLLLNGTSIAWTYNGALPTGLTYLRLNGTSIAWTGLDVGNNGNIGIFNLLDYRIGKMTSTDMVTLLTQLTNRTGSLPATITINDYADYNSPPVEVINAVALLKSTKSVTTVDLGA